MIRLLSTLVILTIAATANAQDNSSSIDVNELFDLKVDSIEQRITIHKWGTDTSYFLHYTVENISGDTLTYITNSCFYYNHYSLTVEHLKFDLNPEGGCSFNSLDWHSLAPGEKFNESEWITAINLKELETGNCNMLLSVPLVLDKIECRVDGRDFVDNEQHLLFEGKSIVIKTIVDNRK